MYLPILRLGGTKSKDILGHLALGLSLLNIKMATNFRLLVLGDKYRDSTSTT